MLGSNVRQGGGEQAIARHSVREELRSVAAAVASGGTKVRLSGLGWQEWHRSFIGRDHEYSDIVVQIVDARNPLLFRCEV